MQEQTTTRIEVAQNGPLLVRGNVLIVDANGNETVKENMTALCRCGHSSNKPFCDGTHRTSDFKG